jgi:pimeloyl-ACP methyl ester carboxylesterase
VTEYAAQRPVRAVVNVDAGLRPSAFLGRLRAYEASFVGPRCREAFAALIDFISGDRLAPDTRAEIDAYAAAAGDEVIAGFYAPLFARSDHDLDRDAAAVLAKVSAPYLLVLGNEPPPGYVEWVQARLATVRVETWPGDGHFLHLVDPRRFAELVRQYAGTDNSKP